MINTKKSKSFSLLLGLAGVAEQENASARCLGKVFELPMLLLAFWIMVEWYAANRGLLNPNLHRLSDWFVWLFFLVETISLVSLVHDKKYYLASNWMNLVIIVVGIPIVLAVGNVAPALRSLRLLLIISLLFPLLASIREVLSRNHLGLTLMVVFAFVLMAGVLIAGIDPAINSIPDGLWWAWVTATTVGYGDVVPVSSAGRVVASVLMLMGLGLFSMIIASFSAYFFAKEKTNLLEKEAEIELEQQGVIKGLFALESRLDLLEQKLDLILEQQKQNK